MFIMTRTGLINVIADKEKPGAFRLRSRDVDSFMGFYDNSKLLKMKGDYAYHVKVDNQAELMEFMDYICTFVNYHSFNSMLTGNKTKALYAVIYTYWKKICEGSK